MPQKGHPNLPQSSHVTPSYGNTFWTGNEYLMNSYQSLMRLSNTKKQLDTLLGNTHSVRGPLLPFYYNIGFTLIK